MKRWILLLLCFMLCGCQSVQEETAKKPQNGIAEAAREGIEVISHNLPEKKQLFRKKRKRDNLQRTKKR